LGLMERAMAAKSFLAFDLGASSGRAILGTLQDGKISLRELHRFPNEMMELQGHLHWNIGQLYQELKQGMKACASGAEPKPESLALDTWGVDFGLLSSDGNLLGLPYAYRDARTQNAPEQFFALIPRKRVYELTGIQVMAINSLFQLYAMARDDCPLLKVADCLLMMPDLLNYFLTGEKKGEFTIATTSQLYNPVASNWEPELFDALGVNVRIMPAIVLPGTVMGKLRSTVCQETGLPEMPVIATASHDTASAVAAAPGEGTGWAYISSGTWSLVGFESEKPIITQQALASNVTNEGGVGGAFRVLKNVTGLWLVQECRKAWSRDRLYEFSELAEMTTSAPAFKAVIDPDHESFMNPPDMPEAICQYCERTGQNIPESHAEFVRCILEGLALKYRTTLDQIQQLSPHRIRVIHIIGGGSKNETLCQFAANATGLPVVAGPDEATAVGNLLVQAMALGCIGSLAEIRETVRRSFPLKRYEPEDTAEWQSAYSRFCELTASAPFSARLWRAEPAGPGSKE